MTNRQARHEREWRACLTEQISRSGRLLFRLAYGVLRDAAAAEDVCQQAFLKAWQCQSAIRDRSGLSAWLAKVVVNESLQVLRRRKTELAALETAALFRAPQQSLPGDPLENRDHVLLALEKLPEITRLVVAMRLMQGLSGNEVKELLGCSAAEVSRQLHCGIERLRAILADGRVEPRR